MATILPSNEPFTPECEVFYEGGPTPDDLYDDCKKNPGHKNFIPMSDLKMEDLPLNIQSEEMKEYIELCSKLVVKISVSYTSHDRPDTWPDTNEPYPYIAHRGNSRLLRTGTGLLCPGGYFQFIKSIRGPCPCLECDQTEQRKDEYWKIQVNTARHVVFDQSEAKKTMCHLFYLTNDKKGVRKIKGTDFWFDKDEVHADFCRFHCITHDRELIVYLRSVNQELKYGQLRIERPFMISHPHGGRQKLTFGNVVYETKIKLTPDSATPTCVFEEKRLKCRLPLFPWSRYNHQGSRNPDDYDVNSDVTMVPGTEFSIPLRQAIPPQDAKYLCCIDITKYREEMHTFPAGTLFYTDLHQSIFFPPETEFMCYNNMSFRIDGEKVPVEQYRKYDIDTCGGSSGAQVQAQWASIFHNHVHCGSNIFDNYNRSTITEISNRPAIVRSQRLQERHGKRQIEIEPEDKSEDSSLDVLEQSAKTSMK